MTFGQLRIEGDEIVFFEYPGLGRFGDVRRKLRPLVLETVTEEEVALKYWDVVMDNPLRQTLEKHRMGRAKGTQS